MRPYNEEDRGRKNSGYCYNQIMKIQKKRIIWTVVIMLVMLFASIGIFFTGGFDRFTDACTDEDRMNNNCVPAGHCGPIGSIVDQTIDCRTKNYDSKFCHGSLEACKNRIY